MKISLISLAVLAAAASASGAIAAPAVFGQAEVMLPPARERSRLAAPAQRIIATHWLAVRPPRPADRWPLVPLRE